MDLPYSIVAVKYVGLTTAQDAMDALRGLRERGSVDLSDAVAISRSADGELHFYSLQSITPQQGAMAVGAAGFVLGLLFGKPLRWTLAGAGIGLLVGLLSTSLRKQEVQATVPYVEKGESLLYMRIRGANWAEFQTEMWPYLAQGLPVLQTLLPSHTELKAVLPSATGRPVPRRAFAPAPAAGVPAARAAQTEAEEGGMDDLAAIKGIGPIIAARLRDRGVRSYAQLANMDVEAIAEIAGVPAGRITRGDWIGQAKTLAGAK